MSAEDGVKEIGSLVEELLRNAPLDPTWEDIVEIKVAPEHAGRPEVQDFTRECKAKICDEVLREYGTVGKVLTDIMVFGRPIRKEARRVGA